MFSFNIWNAGERESDSLVLSQGSTVGLIIGRATEEKLGSLESSSAGEGSSFQNKASGQATITLSTVSCSKEQN